MLEKDVINCDRYLKGEISAEEYANNLDPRSAGIYPSKILLRQFSELGECLVSVFNRYILRKKE